MTTISTEPVRHRRRALAAMFIGLVLTVVALAVVYVDHAGANILARHIREGYPSYSDDQIDSAVRMYLIYLTALGALGVVAWTTTIWATVKGKRWVRMVAPAILALAASVALFNVFVEDTSGDTGLPPLLSWIGVGPCLPGLAACVLLWRSPSRRSLR